MSPEPVPCAQDTSWSVSMHVSDHKQYYYIGFGVRIWTVSQM